MVQFLRLLGLALPLILPSLNASDRCECFEFAVSWLLLTGMNETTVKWLMGNSYLGQIEGQFVSYSYRNTVSRFDRKGNVTSIYRHSR